MRRPWRGTTLDMMEEPGPPGVLRPSGAGAVKGLTGGPRADRRGPMRPRGCGRSCCQQGAPRGPRPSPGCAGPLVSGGGLGVCVCGTAGRRGGDGERTPRPHRPARWSQGSQLRGSGQGATFESKAVGAASQGLAHC